MRRRSTKCRTGAGKNKKNYKIKAFGRKRKSKRGGRKGRGTASLSQFPASIIPGPLP